MSAPGFSVATSGSGVRGMSRGRRPAGLGGPRGGPLSRLLQDGRTSGGLGGGGRMGRKLQKTNAGLHSAVVADSPVVSYC